MYTGSFRDFPLTTALTALNIAVFAAMVLTGVSITNPSSPDLIRWGANNGFLTLGGDYWRLVTANFLHIGIIHIAFNMWCLWSLGRLSERFFGRWQTAVLYLLAGVGGNLLSVAYSITREPGRISAGASAAIFGIAGAIIAGLKFGNLSVSQGERRSILSSMIFFVGFNFYLGFSAGTDNMAHLGGFASGLLMGVPLATSLSRSDGANKAIQVGTLVVTILLFTAAGVELVSSHGQEGRMVRAFDRKDYAAAIKILEKEAADDPGNAELQVDLGVAYERNHQPGKAIAAYKKALAINPRLPDIEEHLHDLEQSAATGPAIK